MKLKNSIIHLMLSFCLLLIVTLLSANASFANGENPINEWYNDNDNNWFYYDSNGIMMIGWHKINDNWYYFYENGVMASDTIIEYRNKQNDISYYVKPSGIMAQNKWMKNKIGWWYKIGDGSYPKDTTILLKGTAYSFDKKGYLQTGWIKRSGKWSYANPSGALIKKGWEKIGNYWYHFNDYTIDINEFKVVNGYIHYFDKNGHMAIGWQNVDGDWFYFNESGYMLVGWEKINDYWYYFCESNAQEGYLFGQMVSDDIAFYEDEHYRVIYYLTPSGKMANNQWIIDEYGKRYKIGNGIYIEDGWIKENGYWYRFNAEGYAIKGWYEDNYQYVYYFDNSCREVHGWKKIGDYWYYFYKEDDDNVVGSMAIDTVINGYRVDKKGHYIPD